MPEGPEDRRFIIYPGSPQHSARIDRNTNYREFEDLNDESLTGFAGVYGKYLNVSQWIRERMIRSLANILVDKGFCPRKISFGVSASAFRQGLVGISRRLVSSSGVSACRG